MTSEYVNILLEAQDYASTVIQDLAANLRGLGADGQAAFLQMDTAAQATTAQVMQLTAATEELRGVAAQTGGQQEALGAVVAATSLSTMTQAEIDATLATTSLSTVLQTTGQSIMSWGTKLRQTGMNISMGISVPLAAVGGLSLLVANTFQKNMELIYTSAGAPKSEMISLSKSVLDLAQNTMQGPAKLAEALFPIESVGIRGAAAMDALKASSVGAAVGQADVVETANAVASALYSQINGAQTADQAMSTLVATMGIGKMHMQDLVAAMRTGILPMAKSAGVSLNDLGAALDVMTAAGMPAEVAATRLRMTFSLMEAPSKEAIKTMKAIGLSQLDLSRQIREGGLASGFELLKQKLDAFSTDPAVQFAAMRNMFGGGRSDAAIITLMGNLDSLQQKQIQIAQGASQVGAKYADMQKTFSYEWGNFISKMETDGIRIGNAIMPAALALMNTLEPAMKKLTDDFTNLDPGVQQIVIGFGALLVIVGPLNIMVGALGSLIGIVVKGVGFAVAAFNALTAAQLGSAESAGINTTALTAEGTAAAGAGTAATAGGVGVGAGGAAAAGGGGLAAIGSDALAAIAPLAAVVAASALAGYEIEMHMRQIWEDIKEIWSTSEDAIVAGTEKTTSVLIGAWDTFWKNMIPPLNEFPKIMDIILKSMVVIDVKEFDAIESAWKAMWSRMPDEIKGPLADAAGKIAAFVSWAGGKVASVGGFLLGPKPAPSPGPVNTANPTGPLAPDWITGNYMGNQEAASKILAQELQQIAFARLASGPFTGATEPPGAGGGAGKMTKMTKTEENLIALADAFKTFSEQTGSKSIDAFIAWIDMEKKLTQAQAAHNVKVEEATNPMLAMSMALGEIQIHILNANETIQQFLRNEVFMPELNAFKNALDTLLSHPTRETAGLQLQKDQLSLQRLEAERRGASAAQLKALDDEIAAIDREIQIRNAQHAILKDQATLADKTLPTEQDLYNQAKLLTAAISSTSGKVLDLNGAVFFQTLAAINAGNAFNHVADAARGAANALTVGHKAGGGLAGGLTVVGEEGPELVRLPSGSYVFPAGQAARMMHGGEGAQISIYVNATTDPASIKNQIMQALDQAFFNVSLSGAYVNSGAYAPNG